MKTKTEIILVVLKYLALLGGIAFSIECGAALVSFVSTFLNLSWAKHVYHANPEWFRIRDASLPFYSIGMSLVVIAVALKATVWYQLFYLLEKFQLKSPFTMKVTKKLEGIAWLLLAVWFVSNFFGKIYSYYLVQGTGIDMPPFNTGDDYFFIAGIVYIISQIFKRGIEMQEENALTV